MKNFQETFANPIQKEHDRQKAEIFRKVTRPFLLRRLKTDKSIISNFIEEKGYRAFVGYWNDWLKNGY